MTNAGRMFESVVAAGATAGRVQEALAALDGLEQRPVSEHVAVFEAVQEALAAQLAVGEE